MYRLELKRRGWLLSIGSALLLAACGGDGNTGLTTDGSWDIFVDWSDENGTFQLQDGGDREQEDDGHLLFHSVGGDLYGGIIYDDALVVTFDFRHNGEPETEFGFER